MMAFYGFGLKIENSIETYDMFKVYISVQNLALNIIKMEFVCVGNFWQENLKII